MNESDSFRDILEPAMKIALRRDFDAARQWFREYVTFLQGRGMPRKEAEETVVANVGYYAGYHGRETMQAVQEVFGAVHPVFGHQDKFGRVAPPPTPEEAFQAGVRWTERMVRDEH